MQQIINTTYLSNFKHCTKGAITSKIKHAIKLKTSPARLAQLLHNCSGRYAVTGCKLKQNANEGCNSCASLAGLVLYCMFYFTCDRSLRQNYWQADGWIVQSTYGATFRLGLPLGTHEFHRYSGSRRQRTGCLSYCACSLGLRRRMLSMFAHRLRTVLRSSSPLTPFEVLSRRRLNPIKLACIIQPMSTDNIYIILLSIWLSQT